MIPAETSFLPPVHTYCSAQFTAIYTGYPFPCFACNAFSIHSHNPPYYSFQAHSKSNIISSVFLAYPPSSHSTYFPAYQTLFNRTKFIRFAISYLSTHLPRLRLCFASHLRQTDLRSYHTALSRFLKLSAGGRYPTISVISA